MSRLSDIIIRNGACDLFKLLSWFGKTRVKPQIRNEQPTDLLLH